MQLTTNERVLIMSGVEAKWRNYQRWGWYGFDYESAWSLYARLNVSISKEFADAMEEAGYGSDD